MEKETAAALELVCRRIVAGLDLWQLCDAQEALELALKVVNERMTYEAQTWHSPEYTLPWGAESDCQ